MSETPQRRRYADLSTGRRDFVATHEPWDDAQRAAARDIERSLDTLDFVRVAFGDPHGLARSKTLTADAFRTVLRNGMDYSPGPFVFDTGHAVAVDFFREGGGIGVPELTGAGDFIVLPDPLTFRVLPHTATRTGWVIGDEYLRSGAPHPLSSRRVLRETTARLAERDLELVVGLEVEWYLTRLLDAVGDRHVGGFGAQGEAPAVAPVDGGYQFNLDAFVDALAPVLDPLADAVLRLGLPLRTIEHESGPGQLEFTFAPLDALSAADAMLLFRTVAKQVCARLGHHASFMALPRLPGFDASGWHLHQSLATRSTGVNVFVGDDDAAPMSATGMAYLGGLLHHAAAASLLCVPTVNGYRRLDERFTLSPDRLGWSHENRGAFLRVLGGDGDPATHVENRMGEPCANPYLYVAGQAAAGLDGIDRRLDPGPAADDPHGALAPPLPRDLGTAIAAFRASGHCRAVLGDPLTECLLRLKESELGRFEEWLAKDEPVSENAVTDWEHREYFAVY